MVAHTAAALSLGIFPKATYPSLCSSSISPRLPAQNSQPCQPLGSSGSQNYTPHQISRPSNRDSAAKPPGSCSSLFPAFLPRPTPTHPESRLKGLALWSNAATSRPSRLRLSSGPDAAPSDHGDSPLGRLGPRRAVGRGSPSPRSCSPRLRLAAGANKVVVPTAGLRDEARGPIRAQLRVGRGARARRHQFASSGVRS